MAFNLGRYINGRTLVIDGGTRLVTRFRAAWAAAPAPGSWEVHSVVQPVDCGSGTFKT
jgi:hypothetical protein